MEIFLIAAWEIKSGSFEMLSSLKGNEALCRLGSEISKNQLTLQFWRFKEIEEL